MKHPHKHSWLFLPFFVFLDYPAFAQSYIDQYLTDTIGYTTIGTSSNQVTSPTDLDFKPGSNELWVINQGTESSGGSTVIFANAGFSNQASQYKQDGNAFHFMSLPSAIAFSENGNFATSPDVLDANHQGGDFTGPTIWPSNPIIYAVIGNSGYYNGSHLDMLHESPYSMGIASDSANVFWLFDGRSGHIVMYNFGKDHGPGHDNHNDGKIHRYTEVGVTRLAGLPSHMVMDKNTGWLYICEPAKSRVLRMNTKTGSKKQNLSGANEVLAEYWEMQGVTWEVYIDTGLTRPCGIDFADDRLIVSDYSNGDMVIYNTAGTSAVEMGRIATGQAGIMGIKIGPDGKIWYVNYTQKKVVRVDRPPLSTDAAVLEIISPAAYGRSCSALFSPSVTLFNNGSDTLKSVTINYVLNNGTVNTQAWTGVLAAGASEQVSIPSLSAIYGKNILAAYTSSPNGTADLNPFNDRKNIEFRVYDVVVGLPFSEGFEGTTFPPADWIYENPQDWDMTNSVLPDNRWLRKTGVSGFGNSSACAKMDHFTGSTDITGQVDDLLLPGIDFSNAVTPVTLTFNVAYAQYNTTTNDSLAVYVSTDCGASWTRVFGKAGSDLSTASAQTTSFTPASSQWRAETVSLDAYAGKADVHIKFHSRSNYGNNLYIDDINIADKLTGIAAAEANEPAPAIYPNPGRDIFYLHLAVDGKNAHIRVFDHLGKEIQTSPSKHSANTYVLDLSGQPEGIYLVQWITDTGLSTQKIILVK